MRSQQALSMPEPVPEPEPTSQQAELSSSSVGYDEPGGLVGGGAALRVGQSDQRPPYDGPLKKDGTPDMRTKEYKAWLARCHNYPGSSAH